MSGISVSFKIENNNGVTEITPEIKNEAGMDEPKSYMSPYLGRNGDFYDVGLAIQNPGDYTPTISVMKKIPINKVGAQGFKINGGAVLGDISFHKLDAEGQALRNPDTGEEIIDDTKSVTIEGTDNADQVVLNGRIAGKNTVKVNLGKGDDTLINGSSSDGETEVDFGEGDNDTHWSLSGSKLKVNLPKTAPDHLKADTEFNYLVP